MKSQSYRRQSAPSLVITKALTRSKTISRESFLVPVCPETCPLVKSFLTSYERSFLLHGHAQLKTGMQTQDRHLFMFNDLLVIAKAKSANQFKQKAVVSVCEMWTASCMEEVCEGSTNPERSFVMGWPTCNCVATFSSVEQKERWLSLLKSHIKEEKEKEEPKTIPLRVYGKGINTYAVTKTLPVSNWDSTNEVIRLALQQFSIIGNVKDYQLWVISKRDNTPYPLIGHEFPFSIQMSHVRQALSHGGSSRNTSPADRRRVMQVEQLQMSRHCQFILKPRPMEMLQQPVAADFSQKSFKRRRSLITWAFWRGSSSHLNDLPLSGAARGCLFGRPLSSVCLEDALPKPVMDMLTFLYHEGSWTRGIFRRPAGARAVRELRDSLDAGEFHLPLTRDHIFIIAGVFKDFLRSIPGSLLCCELHGEWTDTLEDEEEEEEQVQDIKRCAMVHTLAHVAQSAPTSLCLLSSCRMISRLPKDNILLLRYLLAMLHGIQTNAHENQMTSFNLSVCIAPSMLWPPGAPCSPEVEGAGTKKVCELVKFMIEHCQQILGVEPTSLYGGPPRRRNTEEMSSDVWTDPLTDSSYDSLENELDNSSGGSPGFCSRRRLRIKPRHGSLDSILTFSDYDGDPDPLTGGRSPQPDLDSLSLEGQRRQRRRSEPALMYVAKLQPCATGSTEGEEGLYTKPKSGAPTPSSLDSLDSLSNGQTWATSRGLNPPAPTASALKQPLQRGTLKGCGGLHPNSWLRKDRRLSLTQQESEDDKMRGGASDNTATLGRGKGVSSDAGGHVTPLKKDVSGPPLHHRSTGNLHVPKSPWFHPSGSPHPSSRGDITPKRRAADGEQKQSSPSLLSRSGPCLSLFRRHKSHSEEEDACNTRLGQRRRSEPGPCDGATLTRARLPSDPGLKVSAVDLEGKPVDALFCISPYATKAVRDYFSSHPHSNPHSSQQVALALVETHREWLKRCSNAPPDVDLDQLLFAEESYV
ncbi:LOW QUALITY PROTEIN: rho GTPase-activating protein 20-like [Aulostomus maculatus]